MAPKPKYSTSTKYIGEPEPESSIKINEVTLALFQWLQNVTERAVQPEAATAFPEGLVPLDHVWIIIQNEIGPYYNDLSLPDKGMEIYQGIQHRMQLLQKAYGD